MQCIDPDSNKNVFFKPLFAIEEIYLTKLRNYYCFKSHSGIVVVIFLVLIV